MISPVSVKIEQFFSKYPRRSYPKGQILVFADESPDHIFYLVKGKVRKYDVSYRGDEVVVNVFKPLTFFPMSWVINRTPNKYFYKTEEETELQIVPADEALEFVKANPDVLLDLLSRMYEGMEGLLGKMVQLMSGTAKSRLIYELIMGCRRFGLQQKDGSYQLSTSEVDIAARSGLSRETVSREMQKIKEQGLVSVGHSGIVVNDAPALEAALGAEV